MYVIGKTGMGKTNLIQNMAIQDIRNGQGVCVIDPHGEFAEACLAAVPSRRINDVVYFNPADKEFPLGFNIMEVPGYTTRDLTASGIIGVFKKLWASSWGPRLENTLQHAVLSLLAYPGSTLIEVLTLLIDEKFREKIIAAERDPLLKRFWDKQFREYSKTFRTEVVEPVQNKISRFLANPLVRNIIGQSRSSFEIRDIMDKQRILILNLSKGQMGEDNSAFLGALMVAKIQLATMARADVPESARPDFYLFIDEFHNFATLSFANILAEVRKYRLNLILAHQYVTQLEEEVQNAILGTVGTHVMFRVGALDAEILAKELTPVFTACDLLNLDKHCAYLKLMVDGQATTPFSATTLEPIDMHDTSKNFETILRVSRERYGRTHQAVERSIADKFLF